MPKLMRFPKNDYDFGLSKTIETRFDCMGYDKARRMAVVGVKAVTYNKKIFDPDNFTLGELKHIAKTFGVEVHKLLDPETFITKRV